ncbi:39S ribosomal protein L51, mitochondrial [Malassezia brasiliensis]|uniref:Large ribosomal subunit protein mL43 n=1 Tax=Malassezia brasiliensis TaxID=1821822 RepID=A0AAF0IRA2_9BASI|nr:39S ribosomal protein L51, mitochondrial [Malassezia brasiliensis]
MSRARLVRSALSTRPQPGGSTGTFTLPCRKLVIEYCEKSEGSKGTRDFVLQRLAPLARAYPSVEFVVQPRPQRPPLLRGFYLNGRTKEMSTHQLPATQIGPKAQQILDASGKKTSALKRMPVQSTTESARGIWSPLHDDPHEL